jgi:hypothetical protein
VQADVGEREQADGAAVADEAVPSGERRSGVTASAASSSRMVQSPVRCVICSIGLAPRLSCRASQTMRAAGTIPAATIAP